MSTELSVTKTLLAKLLARENITVVHKQISTAAFDLKTRTLYLPIWEDMTSELYDLLGGHEVGHALNTPAEGWHTATHDKDGKFLGSFKDVLNVCEDARIEKLIKREYPGLSKSFVVGYKTLFERDFFGIKDLKDYSKLNIIDRANIYCKCGAFLFVPFTDEERELIRAVESTETWEEVVDVAQRLFERAKEDQDSTLNNLDDLTEELLKQFADESQDLQELNLSDFEGSDESEENQEDSASTESGDESEKSEEDGDGEEDETSDAAGGSSDEDSDEESNDSTEGDESEESDKTQDSTEGGETGGEEGSDESDEPQSITDRKFRERERELISDSLEVHNFMLPTPLMDRIIVPNSVFVDNFFTHLNNHKRTYGNDSPVGPTCVRRFNENNNRYINLLVKEFEMRKNASQYARTSTAKTGELDMSKLHKYKFSNDIFKKIDVVSKGKSHGMIMYVDMSGSMDNCFGNTMEQTLILVAFCRKVGIPFDVYGFCDRASNISEMISSKKLPSRYIGPKFQITQNDEYKIKSDGFHLIHFIGSDLKGNNYRRAFEVLSIAAMNWKNRLYPRLHLDWDMMGFGMGGTPFTQTTLASRPMIEKFKANHKVDVTNVIYLTDGEGTGCFTFSAVKYSPINPKTGKPKISHHIYFTDPKTKRRMRMVADGNQHLHAAVQQEAMTAFIRELTGCKHIGFYISSHYDIRSKITEVKSTVSIAQRDDIEKFYRANGYVSTPHIGYDMYYYVISRSGNIVDGDYSINDDMTDNKISKVFSKAQGDKRRNRVLVSKFAQDIAA